MAVALTLNTVPSSPLKRKAVLHTLEVDTNTGSNSVRTALLTTTTVTELGVFAVLALARRAVHPGVTLRRPARAWKMMVVRGAARPASLRLPWAD